MKELSSGVKLLVFGSEVVASAAAGLVAGRAVDAALTKAHSDKVMDEHTKPSELAAMGLIDGGLSYAAGFGVYRTVSTAFTLLNGILGIHADVPDVDNVQA